MAEKVFDNDRIACFKTGEGETAELKCNRRRPGNSDAGMSKSVQNSLEIGDNDIPEDDDVKELIQLNGERSRVEDQYHEDKMVVITDEVENIKTFKKEDTIQITIPR